MLFGKVNQCQVDLPVHTASFLQKSTLLAFWKLTEASQWEWELHLKLIPKGTMCLSLNPKNGRRVGPALLQALGESMRN